MIPRGLYQLAWSIVNDSLRIPLCLFYRPNLIASAAYLIAYTVISTSQEGAEGSEDAIQQICEGGGLTPTSSSERHATPPPHEHGRDATLSLVANGAGTSKPPTTTVNVGSNQSSNEMDMAVNETSGENTLDNVPTSSVPLCIDLDTLLSTPVAGPWVQAFAIEETELQNLTDVVGNLLELYHNIENTGGISRISLSRKYDSLGGTSQPSPPSRPIATSNSSPALTLTSNATPVHGPQEDSSQDYTLSAPRPEDTEAIAVEADVSQS
ncbi:hypothetical protein FRB98_004895 [Tulasnella sp. 332]|nr:hypothetical protein FRB98_004895 [Tulasnella sp. 332]